MLNISKHNLLMAIKIISLSITILYLNRYVNSAYIIIQYMSQDILQSNYYLLNCVITIIIFVIPLNMIINHMIKELIGEII